LDYVLQIRTGICLDYASVMTAMLRAQDIPTKLVFGYVEGNIYHAWIDVYVDEVGWVNGVIRFDGTSWIRMDPTFASSQGSKNKDLAEFVGSGSNYQSMHYF
jgi:transglutaminase-like putative cysteine protease